MSRLFAFDRRGSEICKAGVSSEPVINLGIIRVMCLRKRSRDGVALSCQDDPTRSLGDRQKNKRNGIRFVNIRTSISVCDVLLP